VNIVRRIKPYRPSRPVSLDIVHGKSSFVAGKRGDRERDPPRDFAENSPSILGHSQRGRGTVGGPGRGRRDERDAGAGRTARRPVGLPGAGKN